MGHSTLKHKCKSGHWLLSLLLLLGCVEEKKATIPSGVFSADTMEQFLYDLHRAEAQLLLSGIRQDTAIRIFDRLESDLYHKYHTDSAKVRRSLRFYTNNINLLDSMYQRLEVRIKNDTLLPAKP